MRGNHAVRRTMLKSKIHRATVTQADLHYVGSLTVDAELMQAADLLPGEQVHVVDIDNGARLETYVIEGPPAAASSGSTGRPPAWCTRGISSSSSATRPSTMPRPGPSRPVWSTSTRSTASQGPGRMRPNLCLPRRPRAATRCIPGSIRGPLLLPGHVDRRLASSQGMTSRREIGVSQGAGRAGARAIPLTAAGREGRASRTGMPGAVSGRRPGGR